MAKIYVGVGHGGSDSGAVSGKHKEKDYALDIANACTAELKRCGATVMQSRTSDVYESAAAKIKECNAFAPDVALDIHLNAGGGNGFEVYRSISGGRGTTLAEKIEAAVKSIGQNSRGVKTKVNSAGKDYFGIIRQTDCPAVLVECAFIDSADVEIVDTLTERQAMGKAIARGILDYFGITAEESSSGGSAAASVSVSNTIVSLPELRRGANNPEYQVRRVQLCLNQMGWTGADGTALSIDGDFGANTEAAIKKMQVAHGITENGIMTAKTWRALLVFKK